MKTSKMTSAIVIGIMTVLTLTLNVWGNEWYKVLVSLLTGVIIGISIFDFKIFAKAFRVTRVEAQKIIKNSPKLITKESKMFARQLLHAFISFGVFFYFLIKIWHGAIGSHNPAYTFTPWMFIILLLSGVVISVLFMNKDEQKDYVGKTIHCFIIKAGKLAGYNVEEEKYFYFVSIICWPVTLLITFVICIIVLFSLILLVLKLLIYTLIFSLQLIISIPLFIGFVFKTINQNNDALIVAWSIAFGGLIGSIALSYIVGVSVGLIIMLCSLISNKYEINPDLFLQGEYNFAQKFAKRF